MPQGNFVGLGILGQFSHVAVRGISTGSQQKRINDKDTDWLKQVWILKPGHTDEWTNDRHADNK